MHQRYLYSLRGIILRLQKKVMGSGLQNTFKNHIKEHSGHGNNFFFYFISYFTAFFFNPLFFAFVQQFTAGENLKVAGDSAGCRRILTTLLPSYTLTVIQPSDILCSALTVHYHKRLFLQIIMIS